MSKPKRSMPIQLVVPEKSPEDLLDTHLAGSDYENFISVLINSVVNAQYLNSSDQEVRQRVMRSALEAMAGLNPPPAEAIFTRSCVGR